VRRDCIGGRLSKASKGGASRANHVEGRWTVRGGGEEPSEGGEEYPVLNKRVPQGFEANTERRKIDGEGGCLWENS